MTFGGFYFIYDLVECTRLTAKSVRLDTNTACNVRLPAYFFQVAGFNKINIGNNSKRPANILKINTIFENTP